MNLEHALISPAAEFDSPEDVVNEGRLTMQQKKAILERWQEDAKQLEQAASENMAGGESSMLHRVSDALSRLADST